MTSTAVARALAALGPLARQDVLLGPLTTYRLGGPATILVEVEEEATLVRVAAAVEASGLPMLVVGRGSNLLVADAGFRGIVAVMGAGLGAVATDGTTVRAGGAASLPVVARRTAAAGLTGFEWAVGVPGSIGGAVRMNAGGHGSDMAASLRSIRVADLAGGEDGGVCVTRAASGLDLGFRSSAIKSSQVVVEAELALAVGDRARSEAEIADIVRWRRANQPGGANAGSVFVNPQGDSAGRLIDGAGAKGLRRGSAAVSDKHANFIQCDPGGSAADVHQLMVEVARRVEASSGIWLRPETRLVGLDWPVHT